MREHPVISAEIIEPLLGEHLVAGVRHHHEYYDGSGYPDGLSGEGISPMARLLCVVDSYDAMSSLRLYRQALTYRECLRELENGKEIQFDPEMVDALIRVLEHLRELKSGALVAAWETAVDIDGRDARRACRSGDRGGPEHAAVAGLLDAGLRQHAGLSSLATEVRIDEHRSMIVATVSDDARRARGRARSCSPTRSRWRHTPAVRSTPTSSPSTSTAPGCAAWRRSATTAGTSSGSCGPRCRRPTSAAPGHHEQRAADVRRAGARRRLAAHAGRDRFDDRRALRPLQPSLPARTTQRRGHACDRPGVGAFAPVLRRRRLQGDQRPLRASRRRRRAAPHLPACRQGDPSHRSGGALRRRRVRRRAPRQQRGRGARGRRTHPRGDQPRPH